MTRKLEETLNLPHLDDLLKEEGVLKSAEAEREEYLASFDEPAAAPPATSAFDEKRFMSGVEATTKAVEMMEGRDHSEAMDVLYKETLEHARNITDLGFNVDHARAARMFEVSANFYKIAMDAKNSKRDAQLKAMQLSLNQQKLELDKKTASNDPSTIDAQAVVVEDRNELLKRLREQVKAEKEGK